VLILNFTLSRNETVGTSSVLTGYILQSHTTTCQQLTKVVHQGQLLPFKRKGNKGQTLKNNRYLLTNSKGRVIMSVNAQHMTVSVINKYRWK